MMVAENRYQYWLSHRGVTHECRLCGKKFVYGYKHRKYCSVECRTMFNRLYDKRFMLSEKKVGLKGHWGGNEIKNCPTCKQQFTMTNWKQIFCSKNCRVMSRHYYKSTIDSNLRTCKICGFRIMSGGQRSLKVNAGCCYLCVRKLKRELGIDQMRPRIDTAKSNAGNLRKRY